MNMFVISVVVASSTIGLEYGIRQAACVLKLPP